MGSLSCRGSLTRYHYLVHEKGNAPALRDELIVVLQWRTTGSVNNEDRKFSCRARNRETEEIESTILFHRIHIFHGGQASFTLDSSAISGMYMYVPVEENAAWTPKLLQEESHAHLRRACMERQILRKCMCLKFKDSYGYRTIVLLSSTMATKRI